LFYNDQLLKKKKTINFFLLIAEIILKQNMIKKLLTFLLTILLFNSNLFSQCSTLPSYCSPSVTNINTFNIGLQNVTLGSTINNSTTATGLAPNYFDFTNLAFSASAGGTVNLSITNGANNSTQARIFIDWDQNGTFGTSSPELVWSSATTTPGSVVTGTFSVPSGQAAGVYRVRVTGDLGGSGASPCALGFGEVEDYTLVVTSSTMDGQALINTSPTKYILGNNTIALRMANLGTSTMTSLKIGYRLNNGTPVIQRLTGLSVAAGSLYTATFSTALNISSNASYSLKIWIDSLNGGATATPNNDTLCRNFDVCPGLSGTYTINPSGSGSTNYTSMNAAIQALVSCGVTAPVVFNIATGTYNQQIDLPGGIDGISSINSVTFQSATGNASNVVYTFGASSSANNFTLRLNGASFYKFRNLTFTATGSSFGTAMLVNTNSNTDSFFNVIFNGVTTTSASSDMSTVFSPNGAIFNWNYYFNCQFNNGSYGAFLQSSTTNTIGASSQNLTFVNCNSTNNYAGGLYLQNLDGLRLIGNRVVSNSNFTSYNGMYIYWIMILEDIKRPIISRNEIQALNANGNGLYLFFMGVNSSVTAARKPQVFNNMVAIGDGSTFSNYGLRVSNDFGSDFLHNTVNIRNTGNTNAWAAAYFESISSGTSSILNNIFTGNNGSPAIRINTVTSWNPCNFNNLHSTGTNLAFLNTTAHTTIASWRTATGRDANSVNVNPNYVSSSNLRLTGANILTVTVNPLAPNDIDNEVRCFFTDIGADFHPDINDIGITSTVHPNGNVAGAGARDVIVVLTNFGTNTVTSATVTYTDGVTPRTINWTGSLAPCQSTNVTFTGTNQFTFTGPWTLTFSATLPNGVTDTDPSNNSITRSGCVGLFGNYTINPSGSGSTNFTTFAAAINAMTTCGIASPIRFTVSSGTYSEQVSIPAINGTSAINTITFDGTNASNTILNFSGTSAAAPHVLRFNNTNNVIVRNMTIRTDNTTNGWPVHFLDGFNNRIASCNIAINGSGATSTAVNLIPVVINGNATSYTTSSTIANNHMIDSNNITAGYFNTTVYCNNPLNTIWIRNNNFTEGWLSGVYAINPVQLRILNNSFRTRTSTTGTYDIFLQSVNLTGTSFFEISGNRITNSGIWSIFLSSCNHSGTEFNRIYNNMIGGGYRATQAYGIQLQSVNRTRIYHNSINIDFATTGTSGAVHISNGSLNEVVNNHLVVSNPNATNIFNLFINPSTAASVVDFNNYFTLSPLADVFIGSSVSFNAAFPNGGGLNSIRSNPRFVNATDLHSTAFCTFKGVNLGVPLDFDNQTRLNPPTIGADEPINTNSNDIGISEVITPRFPLVVGTQPIKVVLRNFGTNAVTSATVNYRVNNGTVISQSWTGNLNTCDTTHVTFTTQNNFGAGASFIETFTTNPNGVTDTRRSNDSIRFTLCPAMFGTYTINPSGSGTTNFTSFNQAIGALVCAGVSGPVRFVVSPATYNEQVSVPEIQGTSATNTIVFDGVNRSNRIISFNTTSVSPAVVRFFLSNNITFRNLTIRSTSTSAGWGVHYFNGLRNRVSNCDIQVNNSIASSAFYPVVVNSSINSATVQSGLANENTTDSSNLDGGWWGISVSMSNVLNTYTAKDNRITESYQYGYYSNGNYQPRVIGNIITLRTTILTTTGVYIINCNNTQGNNIIINGNRIINPGQYGIFLQSCSKSGTDFSILSNNMAGNFRNNTSQVCGIFLNSVNRMQVFHNSIDLRIASIATTNNAALFIQNGTANDVRNNHLVVSNPLALNAFPLWINPATAVSTVNSNNYINNSSAFFLNIANSLVTRNGFRANYPTGGGLNSNSYDPAFVSITDLHSTNTCERGEDLTAFVPLDLDYETRSSTPDIGADEVNALQSNDIGILKINHPRVPFTTGTNTINVTIRNFGSNTVTSATVGYILNNGTPVTQSWTGSLGTCDTANIVFSTTANITGAINLRAYTSNPNGQIDPNRGNDTSRLNACASLSGAYTIGTTGNYPTITAAVNALYCGGVSGPVVFNVQTNNYYEQITINDLITGISAARSVTFQSASGNPNDVVIVNSGTAAQNFTLNLLNAQFLKFRNLTVRNIGVNFNTALLLTNASNDSFFNVIFEGLTTTTNSTNMAIINSPSGVSNNIYFGRCTVNNGSHGSNFNSNANATSSENLTFENCVFNNQFAFGMLNQNLNGLRLIGNTIITNSTLANYTAISNNNIHIATDQNRPLILKNRIWGASSGTGISNIGFGVGSTMNSNRRPIVANNMIQIGNNANACIGIRDNNTIASMIYLHNSVNMGGTSTANSSAAASFESTVAGNIVLNNSFSAYAGNPAIRVNNPTFYRSNFNNLFTTGTILAYNNFTPLNTIALWRSNAFLDTNSVNANPNHSSNFDLRANQLLMDNAGLPLSMVMDDIDGQVRCPNGGCQGSTSNPDIGADEFTPLSIDAAINSINSPATICPGAAAVQVTLRNLGSTTLTSATINYTINGALQTPFSWTGSLIQNATTIVTIGTPTFTSSNSLIRAWVSAPNASSDQNATNDTARLTPSFQLRGVLTIGGSNPDFRTFNDVAIALNTRGICGPVTFNVRQGTYGDRMQLNPIVGSSAVNFITFRPDPANTQPVELIAGNNQAAADNHTIFLNGTRFIQFRQMRITNNSPGNLTFGSVIRFAGAQDSVLFIRNIVTGPTTLNTSINYAVFNHGTGAANYISRCVVDSNVINNGSMGIYLFGNTNSTAAGFEFRNRIRHNDINGSFFYGIQAQIQRRMDIIGNRINMSTVAQTSGAGIWCDFVDSFRIERNSINNFGLYGMFFQRCNSQIFGGTFRSTINNNMIGGRHTNANANGIFFQATTPITQYLNIFHNSISVRSGATGGAIFLQQTSTGQFDFLDIRNNSFANFGTGTFGSYFYNSPTIPNLTINFNNYFSPNAANYLYIGLTGFSVPTGGSPTWNQNSVFGDPGYFSNTNNLHAARQQLSNRGTNIPSCLIDFDNRNKTIGAIFHS
jgi:hypothetical protein